LSLGGWERATFITINPSHIINGPSEIIATAPVLSCHSSVPQLSCACALSSVLSAPPLLPHPPAIKQMCTQSGIYCYSSWFNKGLFIAGILARRARPVCPLPLFNVCHNSPLRQCLPVFISDPTPSRASAVPWLRIASSTCCLLRVTLSHRSRLYLH
jgi:hypothetical protein